MGPDFFQTQMGRKFYEHDVPEIGRSLQKIAKHLEEFAKPAEIPKETSQVISNCIEALNYVQKIRQSWHDRFKGQGAVPYDEAKSFLLIIQRILRKGLLDEKKEG